MITTLALLGGRPTVVDPPPYRWPPITAEDEQRVLRLLRQGELSYYGREGEVAQLEDTFRDFLGVKYALAVSSGTAALHSAFFGLGLGPGDEVLVPTFTFLSTVMPLFVVNATPVLVDAEPDTGNIDPADLEDRITDRTKAIVVTHLCGHPCDMTAITRIARQHGLKLIEDCSHAHGSICNGRLVGTFGDVNIFSLQASKLVAAGQGGILVTDNLEAYERANLLGHFRMRAFQEVHSERYKPFASTGYGLNYRMHTLAAALANSQFPRLSRYVDGRNENLGHLSQRLRGIPGVDPPVVKPYVTRHARYSYKPLYRAEQTGGLSVSTYVAALQAEGVPIERSRSLPLHLEPLFQVPDDRSICYGWEDERGIWSAPRRRYAAGDLPRSEGYAELALSLPPYTDPMRDVMDSFADAFEKVAANLPALLDYQSGRAADTCRAGAG
jgi:dTDP-4-amino-4,6-dideoxygalactose transaminase